MIADAVGTAPPAPAFYDDFKIRKVALATAPRGRP